MCNVALKNTQGEKVAPLIDYTGQQFKVCIDSRTDSFSTDQQIVNGGDWGCIVRDLEIIVCHSLTCTHFITKRSHHSLILRRSRYRDSSTATLTFKDATTVIKEESSVQPISLFSNVEKSSDVYRRNNITGSKHCPAALLTKRYNKFTPTTVNNNML